MVAVVGVVELEDRLAGRLADPHHRLDLAPARPVDLAQQPRRLPAGQFGGGRDVEMNGGVRMLLQVGRGDRTVDVALHRPTHDRRLVLAGRDQRDLARLEDGRDPHRDRLGGDVLGAEEVGGGGAACDRVERDQPGARPGTRARLVEADVAGLADAEDLVVDATRRLDRVLVVAAVGLDLGAGQVAARDVDAGPVHVHLFEQVLPHEPVVAVQAPRRHRVVLIEVEGRDVGPVEALVAMEPDQLAVDPDRGRAGRESQHRRPAGRVALPYHFGDPLRDAVRDLVVGLADHDRQAFGTFSHAFVLRSVGGEASAGH